MVEKDLNQVPMEISPVPSLTQKIVTKIVVVALIIAASGIGILLYWGAASTDVIEVKNSPVPIRTIREHPTAGGVVIISVDYCKKVKADGDARISFVSESREIFLPVSKERTEPTCQVTEFPVLLPNDIPADQYKIKFRFTYDLNPIKRGVVEEFESKPFIVDDNKNVKIDQGQINDSK